MVPHNKDERGVLVCWAKLSNLPCGSPPVLVGRPGAKGLVSGAASETAEISLQTQLNHWQDLKLVHLTVSMVTW